MTYIISIVNNIVQMTYHIAILYEDTLRRLYEISYKHQDLVQKVLTNLQPVTYRTIIRSFSSMEFLEVDTFYLSSIFQNYYYFSEIRLFNES